MKIKKILVNDSEEKADNILCSVMKKNGYRVCPKIRVADVFEVSSTLLGREKFYYALGAHFDFTILDENNLPKFSVEFDGPSHSSSNAQKKDQFKNEICLENNYPLIRIYDVFFKKVGKFTVLSWLLEVWCAAQAFYAEQEKGNIPEEEDFDYWALMEPAPDFKLKFAYNPFYCYRRYFHILYSEKKILSGPQGVLYKTSNGRICCVTVIILDKEKALRQTFSIQSYAFFPVCDFELCREMSLYFLYQKYQSYLKTGQEVSNTQGVFAELNNITENKNYTYYGDFGQNIDLKINTPCFSNY